MFLVLVAVVTVLAALVAHRDLRRADRRRQHRELAAVLARVTVSLRTLTGAMSSVGYAARKASAAFTRFGEDMYVPQHSANPRRTPPPPPPSGDLDDIRLMFATFPGDGS